MGFFRDLDLSFADLDRNSFYRSGGTVKSSQRLRPPSEAVKKSKVAGIASATRPDARRADEAMLGHRGGGESEADGLVRRNTGCFGFFHSLSVAARLRSRARHHLSARRVS